MNKELYNHEEVKRIIENYCSENQINESDVALLIGVHPAHLPRIKSGEMCSYKTLGKIALLGKVSINDLLQPIPCSFKDEIIEIGRQKSIPVCV
jgi:hypothetical protein